MIENKLLQWILFTITPEGSTGQIFTAEKPAYEMIIFPVEFIPSQFNVSGKNIKGLMKKYKNGTIDQKWANTSS